MLTTFATVVEFYLLGATHGDLSLRAGQKIQLSDSFSVQSGTFTAEIDPTLEP